MNYANEVKAKPLVKQLADFLQPKTSLSKNQTQVDTF